MDTGKTLLSNFDIIYDKLSPFDKDGCCGIVKGYLGTLLCCVNLYLETKERKYQKEIYKQIDYLLDLPIKYFSLGYGLAGLAWVISLIKKFNFFDNAEEWLHGYNTILKKYYYLMLNSKDLDYFRGASGLLFYFLGRKSLPQTMISLFIDCLYERKQGIAPSYYIERNRSNINLGTPHGITGIVLILLLIKEKGNKYVDILLHELLNELLSFRRENCAYYFPGTVSEEGESESGLAWCYGDLMATYAILKAGLLLNNRKYTDLAQSIIKKLIIREDCSDKLVLCHGYTSTSMILGKMYVLTNNKALYTASIKWQKLSIEAFQLRLKNYQTNREHAEYFQNQSLFYGFPGILLSCSKTFKSDCESLLLF